MTALPNPDGAMRVPMPVVATPSVPFAPSGRPSADRAARSFKPRGRMTPRLRRSLEIHAPALLVPTSVSPLDDEAVFGRVAPLIVDLGFGMGDTTLCLAKAHPEANVLGIDVHIPGIARVAEDASLVGLTNIRMVAADGIDVLRYMLRPETVAVLQIAFPDPWPKPSQRHRRLVDALFVSLATSRLSAGGLIRVATDVDHYAEQIGQALASEPLLANEHDGLAPRDPGRPVTKFERRAIAAGRRIHDFEFRRTQGVQRPGSNTAGST